ncbi:MAG TPA: PH domain-containing protein [Acidimicrobiales bacterium]|nr:PH domain-containing protein [Acidimicrobiales bacterium]
MRQEQTETDPQQKKLRGVHLQPGETLVLLARPSRGVTWPKYLYTLGLYGIWRKRQTFALTTRRILLSKGVFARSERSIPLNRVDDASFNRRGFAAYCDVAVTTRGPRRVERVGPLSSGMARRFTREVQDRT